METCNAISGMRQSIVGFTLTLLLLHIDSHLLFFDKAIDALGSQKIASFLRYGENGCPVFSAFHSVIVV